MKNLNFIIFLSLIFLCFINSHAQQTVFNYFEGEMPAVNYNNQIGGYALPSEGTINVLVVFAQFPDDNYDIGNSSWPKGGNPGNYTNWVDQTWTGNPTPWSLTDYFNQMSLGKLKMIGKEVSLTTLHSREWYLQNGYTRYTIHKEILQQQLDPTWNFAEFDNWTKTYNYSTGWYDHTNVPDGKVDFIFFIWRNIAMEFDNTTRTSIMNILNMGWYGSIAWGSNYLVDDNQRTIVMGDYNSGVTVADYFYKDAFRFAIHEFAHYVLGGNQFHNGHGFWAMLSGYEVRSYMINAYERYRLGWCNLITVSNVTQTISNASLPDFITTGIAYRIDINPTLNQFFFIENHQKLSRWDNCSKTDYPDDKGLFVIRQDRQQSSNGMAADWMWMITADGRYNWEVNQMTPNPWVPYDLPVYKKLQADRQTGYHELELIPFTYDGLTYPPMEIIYLEGLYGAIIHYPTRQGRGKDAFRPEFNEVFSPWSNPNSMNKDRVATGMGFKINQIENGIATFDLYINTALSAPPSKPQNLGIAWSNNHPKLTWETNLETDMQSYKIWKYAEGSSMIAATITHNPANPTHTWTDYNVDRPKKFAPGTEYIYKVKAVDNTNKESVYSDQVSINGIGDLWKNGEDEPAGTALANEYKLFSNYPNPFNPSTIINYSTKEAGFVKLKVFDILGSEVEVLVNEEKEAGYYSVEFNASDLPSGVYVYTLQANGFNESKKMMLIR